MTLGSVFSPSELRRMGRSPALRLLATIEEDVREQAIGEQDGFLLELANRLRSVIKMCDSDFGRMRAILDDLVAATDNGTSLANERARMPGIIAAAKAFGERDR